MDTAPVTPTPAPRHRSVPPVLRGALVVVGFALLAAVVASQVILPGVTVEGIPVGGRTLESAGRRLRPALQATLNRPLYLRTPDGERRLLPARLGLTLDLPATLAAAYAPGHHGTPGQLLRAWLRATHRPVPVRAVLRWDEPAYERWLTELRAAYSVKPVEAGWRVLPDGRVDVTPADVGRDVRAEVLRQRLQAAGLVQAGRRGLDLPLCTVHPERTTQAALSLGIEEVVSRYRTYFNRHDANRGGNVRLAAVAVDQVALLPGEAFSFNREVGPRVPDSGYREAPVVVNGRLVPGIGGGVCQVSSTLYNAVLLADLAVVTRHRHSIPSAYVPPGRDATVAYDYFDLRFRNAQDRPVVIDTEVGPGWLEARVLGRHQPGERIEVLSEVLETLPPGVEEIPDPSLPAGQRVVKAKGAPGFRVKVWQIVYRDGVEVERRLVSHDRYEPLKAVVRLGTRRPQQPAPLQ